MTGTLLLATSTLAFLSASAIFANWLLTAGSYRPRSGSILTALGTLILGAAVGISMSGASEAVAFGMAQQVILLVALGLLLLSLVPVWQSTAPVLLPTVAAVVGAACLALTLRELFPIATGDGNAEMGAITSLHIGATLLGFMLFVPSYALSILFIQQELRLRSREIGSDWMPSLLTTERIAWRLVLFGFPLYSLGILLGLLWQEQSGRAPSFRPAHVLALASWSIYAYLCYRRMTSGWRGRRASLLAIMAFCVTLSAVLLYGMR